MGKIRLGIIGCGVMGVRHLATAAASPLVEPFAVADRIRERAETAAKKSGVRKVYGDGRELVADRDVDAVIFTTPTANRDDLAIEALKAGKHVLVEKPVAMNAATVMRMIEARGRRVAACCSGRFHAYPSAKAAADFVATGALGDLRVIHCRVYEPASGTPKSPAPAWRLSRSQNGGGILVNWGCYDLDFLLGICDWSVTPRTVLARTWQVPPRSRPNVAPGSDAEAHVIALIACDGGTAISYERGEYMPGPALSSWQIIGTHGSLDLHMVSRDGKVITHFDTTTEKGVAGREIWKGDDTWAGMQDFITMDFIEAIAHGRAPQTSLEKALVLQKVTDAVYASAESGACVPITS